MFAAVPGATRITARKRRRWSSRAVLTTIRGTATTARDITVVDTRPLQWAPLGTAVATTAAITAIATGTIIRDRHLRVAGTTIRAMATIVLRAAGRAAVVHPVRVVGRAAVVRPLPVVRKGATISPRRVAGTVAGNPATVRHPRRARPRRLGETSIAAPVI